MRLFKPCSRDQLRVRRHVAIACLGFNGGIVIGLMAAIFFGPADRATVIAEISGIVLSISIATCGFVGAWFHSAYKSDQSTRDKPTGDTDG